MTKPTTTINTNNSTPTAKRDFCLVSSAARRWNTDDWAGKAFKVAVAADGMMVLPEHGHPKGTLLSDDY
ncbi:MAG: hypothetical protein Fur007_02830 [Rhodoferax sp.]